MSFFREFRGSDYIKSIGLDYRFNYQSYIRNDFYHFLPTIHLFYQNEGSHIYPYHGVHLAFQFWKYLFIVGIEKKLI